MQLHDQHVIPPPLIYNLLSGYYLLYSRQSTKVQYNQISKGVSVWSACLPLAQLPNSWQNDGTNSRPHEPEPKAPRISKILTQHRSSRTRFSRHKQSRNNKKKVNHVNPDNGAQGENKLAAHNTFCLLLMD